MNKLPLLITMFCLSAISGLTEAMDEASEQNFSGSAQLGFIMSTGSSHTTNANGKLSGNYKHSKWTYQGFSTFLHDSDHTENSTHERYEIFGQTQYNYTEKNYIFINTDWLNDTDDGFDYLWNNTVGYGRQLYKNTQHGIAITGQVGPGYRFQPNDDDDIPDQEITANGSLKFDWDINDINRVSQVFGTSYAGNETILISNTAYTAKIYENISLQLSFDVRHNTNTPDDSEPPDTITTLNVLYSF